MNNQFPSRETVNRIREQYPAGTRIELISMDDPYSKLKPGDRGTVSVVDDIGTVFVDWDSGSSLGLAHGADSFKRIENEIIYKNGAEMWQDLFVSKGVIAARVTSLSYLEMQANTTDPEEQQFCRELSAAMGMTQSYASMNVYPYSLDEARQRGEAKLFHEDYLANSMCAGAIYEAVGACECSDGTHKMHHAVTALVEQYGTARLNTVLAIEVLNSGNSFSEDAVAWAESIAVPKGIRSSEIKLPYGVLDRLITCLRETLDKEMAMLEKAAAHILETSARETMSGSYAMYADDIPADIISQTLFLKHIDTIAGILSEYGAVLDIDISPDDGIYMVLGLAYCPNYEPSPEEADEYPDDRQILNPLESRGENSLQAETPELSESEQNLEAWLTVTAESKYKWVEDEIYRLNGRGAMYYMGGEDGIYMRIDNDGKLEAGDYEGAFPHIGEAMFKPVVEKQFANYSDAYTRAMEAGGKQFLIDMFSGSERQPLIKMVSIGEAEKQSVLKQIRDAQKAPKPPHKEKTPDKGKGGVEL